MFKILRYSLFLFITVFSVLAVNCFKNDRQRNTEQLSEGFLDPPANARPWAYWVWTNGNFNYSRITYELEDIKAKGLGGFDIFDVGERYPKKGVVPAGPAFLGRESLEAIHYTMKEAERLGLRLGLITSSSWNAGGAWVKPEHATMALFPSEKVIINGPSHFSEKLPFPQIPKETPKHPDDKPVFYEDIAVIAFPNTDSKIINDKSLIKDITSLMDKDGRLEWDVPEGEWAVIRFVCTNTGKRLHAASPKSDGFVIDHFNPEATEKHFQYIIDQLLSEVGKFKNTPLEYLYLPSYEVRGISWTPNFQQEFKKRRGYDIIPYLPSMTGMTIRNNEITARFNYDFEKTICDLIVDAHYKKAADMSNKYGLKICAESGGPGRPPVEALKTLGALDVPRGEFWLKTPIFLVKEIACAAHIYGKNLVDQEAFPVWEMWQEGPSDLKYLADRAFCEGMNKVTLHTYSHTPPESGMPGWVFWCGTHFGPNRIWWPKIKPFMDYLGRCCYMLRKGLFVGDVCYYYGDQGFNFVPAKHIDPSLGYGYDYDVTNPEVILTRMRVINGKIVLPDGMRYELLVLPEREDMDLDVLVKLEEMIKAGATIVGKKPIKTNGLRDYPNRDNEVKKLADKIWGHCNGKDIKENSYGKGKIIWGRTLRDILQERGIGPDFMCTDSSAENNIDYIHRKTENEDIYFVINKSKSWKTIDCTFRVKGKIPELWNPKTGEIKKGIVYKETESGTKVSMNLQPEGSVFVVFRNSIKENHIISISRDNESIFPVSPENTLAKNTVSVLQAGLNNVELLIREKGTYTIKSASGKDQKIKIISIPVEMEITGPWEIRFPAGKGAPYSVIFPNLASWTKSSDDGIKYFSGIGTYYKEFELSQDLCEKNMQIILDLGDVRLLADVYLNGKHIGILWNSPYRADITDAVKPGKNNLIIEIANTWNNRLKGDAKSPQNRKYAQTHIKYIGGPLRKGFKWADVPLMESGLLGPVKLIPLKKVTINLE